jgi:oligopeptide/dipeptide ABC transporter ATP-binding protein
MEEVLRVEDLKTYFYVEEGVVKAVDGISFSLKKGETLGIAGESGSGKTVTSLSLLRLIPWPPGKIISGKIYLEGRDLLKIPYRDMVKIRGNDISMIFQDPMTSLNPVFTVGDQIIETILIHQNVDKKTARSRALKLLKEVGIPNTEVRFSQYPHEYSGGMRQRAMIAMSLACNPKILIADEPTTALDVTIQAQILDLMNKMKDEFNNSIILITHDLGVIAEMVDNLIIMYAGRIVEHSDVRSIFYNPKHPYTWGLLESIPKLEKRDKKLIPIKGNPPSLVKIPEGCSFNPRCKYKKNICQIKEPDLVEIEKGHRVACHLSTREIKDIRSKVGAHA